MRVHGKSARRAIFAALVVAAAGCDSPEERVRGHYERGLELLEENRSRQATLEFRNALRIDRDHGPSRFEMGKIAEEAGDLGRAVAQYRSAAELQPQNLDVRIRLARLLIAGGVLDEADGVVEQARALAPENPEVRASSAALALRLGNAEQAVTEARAALEAAPDLLPAHLVLISERVQAGDSASALDRLDGLLASDLSDEAERRGLNLLRLNILSGMGDSDGVKAQLARMAELYPDETRFRTALAQLLIREGDLEGAERELRSVAEAVPDDITATLDVVRFVLRARGVEAAEAELRAQIDAAAQAEKLNELRIALAELLAQSDRRAEARAVLEEMVEAEETESAARARIALARFALADDDRARAESLIAAVLETDPENGDALALRASLAIEDYRPQDAIADLRVALEGDPDNARLMLLEAQAHERAGNLSLSGERLAAATRASEYAPDISQTYANFLISRGDLSAAESILAETSRRHPTNAGVLSRLAETRLRLEDWAGAEQAAQALNRLENGGAAAAQIAAASLTGQGRFEESSTLLQQLSDELGDPERTMASLVGNYLRAGERDRAVEFVESILADNPANQRALLLRAELHVQDGENEAAFEKLDALIDAAPESPVGYIARARLELALGRQDDALKTAEAALRIVEVSPALQLIAAQIYEQQTRFDEAIAIYRALYDRNPNSILYANNLVSLLAEHRADEPETIEFAARVAQRLRGYDIPHLQDTYGWVMFLNGDYAAALGSLEAAAEGLPDNALVRYHLGRTYAALDEVDQARSELEASLAIDPDFPKAVSARAALDALPSAAVE